MAEPKGDYPVLIVAGSVWVVPDMRLSRFVIGVASDLVSRRGMNRLCSMWQL
jgi:hypothetical protein